MTTLRPGLLSVSMEPLCVSREDGAKLCGITPGTWDRWRRLGILPDPIPGTERWFLEQVRQTLLQRCGMVSAQSAGPRGAFADVGKNALRRGSPADVVEKAIRRARRR